MNNKKNKWKIRKNHGCWCVIEIKKSKLKMYFLYEYLVFILHLIFRDIFAEQLFSTNWCTSLKRS